MDHIHDPTFKPNFENDLKILHKCNKGNRMNVLEELEIYKVTDINNNNNNMLNDKLIYKYNCLFDTIISHCNSTD